MSDQYNRNPNIECAICHKLIYRRPCETKKGSGKAYCSMACYGIACRKEIFCAVCSKSILSGLNKKTCSRNCANKQRIGIKYKIHSPKDNVKNQRSLKIKLLNQRGKNCERCKYNKIEILQVHHKNRNRENNKLENLELICPNCHAIENYFENSWLRNI